MLVSNADSSKSVAFLVLAFNNPAHELNNLFRSLRNGASAAGAEATCILVSNDDDFDAGSFLSDVELISGHGNVGFAAGISIGIAACTSDYVVIVNPDVTISTSDATRFVSELVVTEDVLVPVLKDASGELAYTSYEDWVFSAGRKIAEKVCRRFLFESEDSELPRWAKICGAFVGMPTALAKNYGPFDEAFFMYGEDRDLTSRLRGDKVRLRLIRSVSVTHQGGGSGGGMNKELAAFKAESALRIAFRRYGRFGFLLKSVDLWFEAALKQGPRRAHAMAGRRVALAHWRSASVEAPRLDISSLPAV